MTKEQYQNAVSKAVDITQLSIVGAGAIGGAVLGGWSAACNEPGNILTMFAYGITFTPALAVASAIAAKHLEPVIKVAAGVTIMVGGLVINGVHSLSRRLDPTRDGYTLRTPRGTVSLGRHESEDSPTKRIRDRALRAVNMR